VAPTGPEAMLLPGNVVGSYDSRKIASCVEVAFVARGVCCTGYVGPLRRGCHAGERLAIGLRHSPVCFVSYRLPVSLIEA